MSEMSTWARSKNDNGRDRTGEIAKDETKRNLLFKRRINALMRVIVFRIIRSSKVKCSICFGKALTGRCKNYITEIAKFVRSGMQDDCVAAN